MGIQYSVIQLIELEIRNKNPKKTVITLKYWDIQAFANSFYLDQMLQNVASDQSLNCLPFIQQYLDTQRGIHTKMIFF